MVDFKLIPSLDYLAGVKISLAILYNPQVSNLVFGSSCHFPEVLEEVYGILDDFKLPAECCKKIKIIAMNMIQELITWRSYHSSIINPSQMSMTYLCWTTLGAIDKLKTAHKLLSEPHLDIVSRFRLACEYCFYCDAFTISETMSDEEERRSSNHTILGRWIRHHHERPVCLISYITDTYPEIDDNELLESFITCIESEIDDCSVHELSFLLDKKPAEHMRILRTAALSEHITRDVRLFCFQQLDQGTQEEVIEKFPVEVLLCFLTWPFQSCFLDLADRIWDTISPEDFCTIIRHFLTIMKRFFWQNFELVEILQQLWHRSPVNFKDRANQSSISEPLNILLNCKSLESLNINRLDEAYTNSMRSPRVMVRTCVLYFDSRRQQS
ncbi:hypothetical protein AVEN_192742-1 [Araneus ventricosus]|uniref:Uncharacterized protein n=1 Tax=Araneus ventricosus TaxID=182803 RepID=A0A4Y2KP89_ARAVE|nr:hypothetical protein AVEN_192742-1 [Araneus ventricosus]